MPLYLRMIIFSAMVTVLAVIVNRLRPGSWAAFKKMFADYFNETTHPANLAMCRILLFGFFVFFNVSSGSFYASLPKELLVPPAGTAWLLQHIPIQADLYQMLMIVFKVSCLAAMIGLLTPIALLSVFVSGWYVLGVPHFFGKVGHSSNIYLYAALVLAFSPCADALSVDALIRRKPFFGGKPSTAYARPLHMIWLLLGLVYLFPGIWKVVQGGPRWVFSDSLKNHLYQIWWQYGRADFLRIDRWPLVYRGAAASVILFELFFILFLVQKRFRWLCVVSGLFFHNMTAWAMGIKFYKLLFCYTTFIDWAWVGRKLTGKKEEPVILQSSSGSPLRDWPMRIGVAIFMINVVFGFANHTAGWPFACFPTFGWVQGPTTQHLAVELIGADGQMVLLENEKMNKLWRDEDPHKIRGLSNTIMRTDLETRQRLALGLAKFLKINQADEGIAPSKIRFVKEIRWLDPDRWGEPPVSRETMAELYWSSF